MEAMVDPIKEGRALRLFPTKYGQAIAEKTVEQAINGACRRAMGIAHLPIVAKPAAKKSKATMQQLERPCW